MKPENLITFGAALFCALIFGIVWVIRVRSIAGEQNDTVSCRYTKGMF